jgi:hypothetical protein
MGGQWRVLALSVQCGPRCLVQGHEAAFPELGPFNHQAIVRDGSRDPHDPDVGIGIDRGGGRIARETSRLRPEPADGSDRSNR